MSACERITFVGPKVSLRGPSFCVSLFWQLPVLVTPLLRYVVLLLLGVWDLSPGFDLALKHEGSESVFEQIALGLEKT